MTYIKNHYIKTGEHKRLLKYFKPHYMSGEIYVIVPCLCNEVSGMSEVICAILCLCNEAWGMSRVFTRDKNTNHS
jgi:hypothetical protein